MSTLGLVSLLVLCLLGISLTLAYPSSLTSLRRDSPLARTHAHTAPHRSLFAAESSAPDIPVETPIFDGLVTLLVSSSYMSIIVTIMTLPPCLSYIYRDPSFLGTERLPAVLFLATLATMAGKFSLGPPTDQLGGNLVMKLAMLSSSLLLLLCSFSHSALSFGSLWVLLSFFYATPWGACSKLIRDIFPQEQWASKLGLVAAFSRLGSLGSSILYGALLSKNRDWKMTFRISALIQAVFFVVYIAADRFVQLDRLSHHSSISKINSAQGKTVSSVLRKVSQNPIFWSMFLGKIVLMVVGQFISFIPLYLTTGIRLEPDYAAKCAACFSTGSLFSNLVGAKYYQKLTPKGKVSVVSFANLIATACSGILAAHAMGVIGLTVAQIISLLTTWGATWATAFYVPPGIVALELGGVRHAALITNVLYLLYRWLGLTDLMLQIFDAGGFFGAAVFSYYGMKYGQIGAWGGVLGSLSVCGFVAFIAMFTAMSIALAGKDA